MSNKYFRIFAKVAEKFIIYQLLLRVFGNTNENCVAGGSLLLNGTGKFSSVDNTVLESIKQLSITHIWYTGVIEHVTASSFEEYGIIRDNPAVIKGEAGSPYAIKDYYDVNPYLADDVPNRMAEFEELVERTHKAGLKVIIDFIPNHLAREYFSDSQPSGVESFGSSDNRDLHFDPQNNFYYFPGKKLDLSNIGNGGLNFEEMPAKATGNDSFTSSPSHNDWYETVKLNYGVDYCSGGVTHFDPVPKTWRMMLDILLFWSSKGVDGFRCDMAEMVPVEFWNWAISKVKESYPQIIFIAEVYNPRLYDSYLNFGGFDYLYDKVGLYDNLKVITQRFVGKAGWFSPAGSITSNWQSLGDKQYSMLNFLENHDEQRVASDFNIGDGYRAIPELAVSLLLNRAPFMLYFGEEFGEKGMLAEGFSGMDGRTSIFDYCSAPSVVRYLKTLHKYCGAESQNGGESCRRTLSVADFISSEESLLKSEEKELYKIHKELLSIAIDCDSFRKGETFDLEYANYATDGFDTNDHYAFARYHNGGLAIVAVDFSQKAENLPVKLPQHLFTHWQIASGTYKYIDLLDSLDSHFSLSVMTRPIDVSCQKTSTMPTIAISPESTITLPMQRYGVGIIVIKLK